MRACNEAPSWRQSQNNQRVGTQISSEQAAGCELPNPRLLARKKEAKEKKGVLTCPCTAKELEMWMGAEEATTRERGK
jgi:hypothetical protein